MYMEREEEGGRERERVGFDPGRSLYIGIERGEMVTLLLCLYILIFKDDIISEGIFGHFAGPH